VEHKFQDLVNRLQWNACAFSGTGDYVMGAFLFHCWILIVASTVKAAHDIYVWERAMGSLIKILEGPKEELIDVDVFSFLEPDIIMFSGILRSPLSLPLVWTPGQYTNGAPL
jgi:hypothetical protein